jgi:hypothetical protein
MDNLEAIEGTDSLISAGLSPGFSFTERLTLHMQEIKKVINTDRIFRRGVIRVFENYAWAHGYEIRIQEKRRLWNSTVRVTVLVPLQDWYIAEDEIDDLMDELEKL